MNYYNEFDPKAAAWIRELIAAGAIPPGEVDERSIEDVRPSDLAGYTQCHFFAGIAGWSYALALAGWPSSRSVWTGSCPCQPFSAAGKGAGFDDQRHLWPAWFHLIRECRPATLFGEQVASKAADPWIDLVHADLEGMGYAFGCVPFSSASVGAPHIRDRNYWFGVGQADADNARLEGWRGAAERAAELTAGARGLVGGMADSDSRERNGVAIVRGTERDGKDAGWPEGSGGLAACGNDGRLAYAEGGGWAWQHLRTGGRVPPHGVAQDGGTVRVADSEHLRYGGQTSHTTEQDSDQSDFGVLDGGYSPLEKQSATGPLHGHWRAADWLACRDGKFRPVEPGTQPLAHGLPARVGRLRGYGNAINPHQAAEFVIACMETMQQQKRNAA